MRGGFRDDVDWSASERAKLADELRAVLSNLLLRVSGAKVLQPMVAAYASEHYSYERLVRTP